MGKNNEIKLPDKKAPAKPVSTFQNCFSMHRVDKMGQRINDELVAIVKDGPAKGYCVVNMTGYALIPIEEFGKWRTRWRAVKMVKRALKIIRKQVAQQKAGAVNG